MTEQYISELDEVELDLENDIPLYIRIDKKDEEMDDGELYD